MKHTGTPNEMSELFSRILQKALKKEMSLEKAQKNVEDTHPTLSSLLEDISIKEGEFYQKCDEARKAISEVVRELISRHFPPTRAEDIEKLEEGVSKIKENLDLLANESITYLNKFHEVLNGIMEYARANPPTNERLKQTLEDFYRRATSEKKEERYEHIHALIICREHRIEPLYERIIAALEQLKINPQNNDAINEFERLVYPGGYETPYRIIEDIKTYMKSYIDGLRFAIKKLNEDYQQKRKQQEKQNMQKEVNKTMLARKLSRVLVRVLKDLTSREKIAGYSQLADLYLTLSDFVFIKESIMERYKQYTEFRDAAFQQLDKITATYKNDYQGVKKNYTTLRETIANLINEFISKFLWIQPQLLHVLKYYGRTYEGLLPSLEEMEQNPKFQEYLELGQKVLGWFTVTLYADVDKLHLLIYDPRIGASPIKRVLEEADKIVTAVVEPYLKKVEENINRVEEEIIALREKLNVTNPEEEIEKMKPFLPWYFSRKGIKKLQERLSLKFQERQKTQTLK